jgi:hypothetical protein
MAVAGDILIKLAADFAEFSEGMDKAIDKLDQFGNQSKATGDKVQGFVSQVQTVFKALAIEQAVERLYAYAEGVQKLASDISTMAGSYGLTTDALQAYQYAAVEAGQKTDAIVTSIQRFNVAIGQAQQGSKQQLDVLNQLGVMILDSNGKLRPQSDLLTEVAQKLLKLPEGAQRARDEVVLFGRAGQEVNVMLTQLAKGLGELDSEAKAAGYTIDAELIKKADELTKRSELAEKNLARLVATIYLPVKTDIFDALAATIQRVQHAMDALDISKIELVAAVMTGDWLTVNRIIGGAIAGARAPYDSAEYVRATKDAQQAIDGLAAAQRQLDTAQKNNLPTVQFWTDRVGQLNKQLADARATQQMIMGQSRTRAEQIGLPTLPPITTTGTANPPTTEAANQAERVSEELKKWRDLTAAANEHMAMLKGNTQQTADAVQLAYERQKKIDDLVAGLSKEKGAAGREGEIRATATAMVDAQQKATQFDKAMQDADKTNQKYGDGQRELIKGIGDLQKQLATGYLQTDAYRKALKDLAEQADKTHSEFVRAQGGYAAFQQGIEDARKALEKSNDAYSMGQQTFNAFISATTEGLQALEGQSHKTFGQIALDFANMLAAMAEKAALSQVFNWMLSALGMSTGSSAVVPMPAPAGGYSASIVPGSGVGVVTNRQSGGPVVPGQGYLVGEGGPERFVPSTAGTISPLTARSGPTAVVNVSMAQGGGTATPSQTADFARRVRQAVVDQIQNEQRPGGTLYAGAH